jgi:acyl-CoA synthetase (AMP-forming)/AMP-acid ligase II
MLRDFPITTICAPPTVWRMLVQEDLAGYRTSLRELASAGEPLNPEIIATVRSAWGATIREGYGQTETTALIATSPGMEVKPGLMGRPMPGYAIALLNGGEVCVETSPRPVGLMAGYGEADGTFTDPSQDAYYHTADIASCDADGYFTYIGRTDDVFKSSDYRVSPFELESALIEHAAVAEAAVVPTPPLAPGLCSPSLHRARAWLRTLGRDRARHIRLPSTQSRTLQAHTPHPVRRVAQDHLAPNSAAPNSAAPNRPGRPNASHWSSSKRILLKLPRNPSREIGSIPLSVCNLFAHGDSKAAAAPGTR